MKFAISSHTSYSLFTEDKVTSSLINTGINPDDIYFFCGSSNSTVLEYQSSITPAGYHRFICPHNSLDFTAHVSALELSLQSDYWFFLHDTCIAGPTFLTKFQRRVVYPHNYIRLHTDWSMNIGSVSQEYLLSIEKDVLLYKNTSDDLQPFKGVLVRDEDIFQRDTTLCYSVAPSQALGPIDIYRTNSSRLVIYFPDIDFYKIKANWEPRTVWTVTL